MNKKICPYCDQPIGNGMYCKGCKRIVLRPQVWNVDYYLNERHSANEESCQYHGDLHTGEMRKKSDSVSKNGWTKEPAASKRTAAKKSTYTNSKSGSQDRTWSQNRGGTSNRAGGRQNGKTKSPFSKAATLLVIYFVLMFGGTLVTLLANMNLKNAFTQIGRSFNLFRREALEYEAPEWENGTGLPETEEEDRPENWERSDEEVIAAGAACNAYGHFSVSLEEMQDILETELARSGRSVQREGSYSYNSVHDEFTWFETENYYDYYDSDQNGYTIVLNSDTATGAIHGIVWYTEQKEELLELADVVVESLKQAGIAKDLTDGGELYETAVQSEELAVLDHGLEIRAMNPEKDGGTLYQMMIFAPGFYTEGE